MTDEHAPLQQGTALLPYLLTCTPDPLFVSTQATKALGKLTLMIGATFPPLRNSRLEDSSWSYGPDGTGGGSLPPGPSSEVWCQKFVVDLPRGEEPTDLARIPDSQTLNTLVVQLPQWNVSRALVGTDIARFTFTPARGGSVSFDGSSYITAVIDKIPINAEPGTASVTITETTSSSSATAGFADRHAYRDAPKVTTEFYFYDLHPREPAIARGDAPVLEWKGNTSNTDFTVYWSDGEQLCSEVLQPSAEAWYPRRNIPRNSTTFLVMAEHRPPGQTTTIRRHLTTTVEVIDPDIIAHEITTKGNVTITDGKTLRTDKIERASSNVDLNILGNALVTGDMTANGWLWSRTDVWADNALKANEIGRRSGSGQIQVASGVNAGGGGVSTSGNLTASNITASGDITSSSALRANNIRRVSGSGDITVHDTLRLLWSLNVDGNITSGGKAVIRDGSQMELEVVRSGVDKKWYLWGQTASYNNNVIGVSADTSHNVTNTTWRVVVYRALSVADAELDNGEPDSVE